VNLGEFQPEYLIVVPSDDVAVVRFTVPRLTEEINLEQLGHELGTLIDQHGCRKMVVSLSGLEYLTSSGLGKLIALHRKMHREEGVVVFCDAPPTVADILHASRLDTYFNGAPDIPAAMTAIQAGPRPGSA